MILTFRGKNKVITYDLIQVSCQVHVKVYNDNKLVLSFIIKDNLHRFKRGLIKGINENYQYIK